MPVINLPIVIAKVSAVESQALEAAATGMRRGLIYAVGIVQREYLQGPRPKRLGERTTRLRQSITSKVQVQEGRGVIGRIGTNVKYAAFHEFGFHGVETVRSHTRVVQQVNALGIAVDTRRPIRDAAHNFVGFKGSRKASASAQKTGFTTVQFVKSHARKIDYAGRPFIRPAVAKATSQIVQEINNELFKLTNS